MAPRTILHAVENDHKAYRHKILSAPILRGVSRASWLDRRCARYDTSGIGYYYSQIQTTRLNGIIGLEDHTQGFEAFYNLSITPAANLTLDVQVVDSIQSSIDDAVIVGGGWDCGSDRSCERSSGLGRVRGGARGAARE